MGEYVQQFKDSKGMYVFLELDGKVVKHYVHDLVYSSFKGRIPKGYEVFHLDGDKTNNHVNNLSIRKNSLLK